MHILFSLIRRLMASTIRTGTVSSVLVVITLTLFLADKQSNGEAIWQHLKLFEDDLSLVIVIVVWIGFAYCLGRIYTLTMLYNLNNRSSLKHESANTNDAHRGNTMSIMTEIRACLPASRHIVTSRGSLIIIHLSDVHRMAIVHGSSVVRSHIVQPSLHAKLWLMPIGI
jgi:hypothetical protein